MRRTLVAVAVALVALSISPVTANVPTSNRLAALPAPPIEPVCIVIWGQKFCW